MSIKKVTEFLHYISNIFMLNFKASGQNCSFCGGHLQEMIANYEHQTKWGALTTGGPHTASIFAKEFIATQFLSYKYV